MMQDFDVLIQREKSSATQTLGELTVYQDRIKPIYDCKTVELEVDCNATRDDAIPNGTYRVIKRVSKKYGNHFHILNVPNRKYILIHNANYSRQLLGCVAVGKAHADIDRDGLKDVTSSKATLKQLVDLLPDQFILKIVQK